MGIELSAPPTPLRRILVAIIALAMTLVACLVFAYADGPTTYGANFRPVELAMVSVISAVTAYLLLLRFYIYRTLDDGLLSTAFAYSALMTLYRLAMLPGVLCPLDKMPVGSHLGVWTWGARLTGTALLISFAQLIKLSRWSAPLPPASMRKVMPLILLSPYALTAAVLFVLPPWVPDLSNLVTVSGNYHALAHSWICYLMFGAWMTAFSLVVLITRLKNMLQNWLALSCYCYLLYLVIVFSSPMRLTLGWYISRFFELSSALILLSALLFEVFTVKKRLRDLYENAYETSIRDALTGIFSRRHFDKALQLALERQSVTAAPLSLLMVDIDFFKQYNDHFGHVQGDICLQKIAHGMAKQLRGKDTLARYGGEEFAIILEGSSAANAALAAERIRKAVAQLAIPAPPIEGEDARREVSISVGVYSHNPAETIAPEERIRRADAALYEAKRQGRNRAHIAHSQAPLGIEIK